MGGDLDTSPPGDSEKRYHEEMGEETDRWTETLVGREEWTETQVEKDAWTEKQVEKDGWTDRHEHTETGGQRHGRTQIEVDRGTGR